MKIKIQRSTTLVTSFEIDLSSLNIKDFKQSLIDSESDWIADQFESIDELSELVMNNSEIASELFNVCNSYGYGIKDESFLDDEEFTINS